MVLTMAIVTLERMSTVLYFVIGGSLLYALYSIHSIGRRKRGMPPGT